MKLSLLVQDTQIWDWIYQSKLLEPSWTEPQSSCIFLAIVKSPNIWACAVAIQTDARDGAF